MSGFPNKQSDPAGAIPVYGAGGGVPSSDGTVIVYPDAWAQTWTYNGDSTLNYTDITDPSTSIVYRQTFTYSTGLVATKTGWVAQ